MIGPRHVVTSYEKKMFDIDHEKHMKRIETMRSPIKKQAFDEKETLMRSTFVDLHNKHLQFQTTEKISSLDKTNQNLLSKLVKISKNEKPPLFNSTHWSGHPGTLNTTYRKKELDRIARENEAMAKRLISQQSAMDHKKLKLDFVKQKEFGKNARKVEFGSPKSAKLPPLQSPKANESPKNFRIKNKKKSRKLENNEEVTENKTQDKTEDEASSIKPVPIPKVDLKAPQEAISKDVSQTQEIQEEEINTTNNQASQRSNVKPSKDISLNQSVAVESVPEEKTKEASEEADEEKEEKDEKEQKKEDEKSQQKEEQINTERSAIKSQVMQPSSRQLGENKEEVSRKASTVVSRKESKVKNETKSEVMPDTDRNNDKSVEKAKDEKIEVKEAEKQEPENQEQKTEKQEEKVEKQEQKAESQEQKIEKQEQKAESQEQKIEKQEQKLENQEQKAENQEQKTESTEAKKEEIKQEEAKPLESKENTEKPKTLDGSAHRIIPGNIVS